MLQTLKVFISVRSLNTFNYFFNGLNCGRYLSAGMREEPKTFQEKDLF